MAADCIYLRRCSMYLWEVPTCTWCNLVSVPMSVGTVGYCQYEYVKSGYNVATISGRGLSGVVCTT